MSINEKMAYLKGLMEGSGLTFGDKEQKIVGAMMDMLSDMAAKITEVDEDLSNLYDGFDDVCDSLDDIEEDIGYLMDDEGGCSCGHHHDGEESLYDVECPKCHEVICIDEDTLLGGDIDCPNCGEKLEFDFDISPDCKDCGKGEEE